MRKPKKNKKKKEKQYLQSKYQVNLLLLQNQLGIKKFIVILRYYSFLV